MSLLSFLRYNTRHHLWWPRGYKGRWWLQLNPISSVYDGTWRLSLHEPRWLFRLRQRAFAFGGRQRCPERGATVPARGKIKALPDTWDIGPDRNRTCSYCGSIHPDDLMTIARKTGVDERYGIEGATKSYKVYVRQPGVRNASEGAIKFYMWHAPAAPTDADQKLFADARRLTSERFRAQMDQRFRAVRQSA